MGLTSGIINTVFLTFLHNQYAIAFLSGALISLALLIYKPSRYPIFLLIGFTILLIGFEYDKHIIQPLQDQTIASLGVGDSDTSAKLLLLRTFQKLIPIGFFTVGWGLIFSVITLLILKSRK